MTLRHLKIYLEVYRTENITRAAKTLCMTQPAVTRSIQEIESYYGIRLFERINRHLRVTESGKALYQYALHIVDSFDQMELGMRNWDELGKLRVGSSITIGNSILPRVLKRFREEHPGLMVQATVNNGETLQQALLDNRLDFAVIECAIHQDQLSSEVIGSDRLVMVLPPEDPRRLRTDLLLEDVADDPLLLREEGSVGRSMVDRVFAGHGFAPEPVMESVSTQALIQAVHEGLGISFLPEQMVCGAIKRGYVSTADLADETFLRKTYLVWHSQKFLTKSAQELMNLFRQSLSAPALMSEPGPEPISALNLPNRNPPDGAF